MAFFGTITLQLYKHPLLAFSFQKFVYHYFLSQVPAVHSNMTHAFQTLVKMEEVVGQVWILSFAPAGQVILGTLVKVSIFFFQHM